MHRGTRTPLQPICSLFELMRFSAQFLLAHLSTFWSMHCMACSQWSSVVLTYCFAGINRCLFLPLSLRFTDAKPERGLTPARKFYKFLYVPLATSSVGLAVLKVRDCFWWMNITSHGIFMESLVPPSTAHPCLIYYPDALNIQKILVKIFNVLIIHYM